MTEQFDKARAGKFTEEELARAKTIIVTTDVMEQQTNSRPGDAGSLDELYGLGYSYREQFNERIQAVTLDDVRRVAKKYLHLAGGRGRHARAGPGGHRDQADRSGPR